MNFKQKAQQLESYLQEAFQQHVPISLLPDGSLAYNDFIIKQNDRKQWQLKRGKGSVLDSFNLKSCAIAGAKLYKSSNFGRYNELKLLDNQYHKHATDADIFKYRYKTTKDTNLRDIFVARYVEAKQQSVYARQQITSKFRLMF